MPTKTPSKFDTINKKLRLKSYFSEPGFILYKADCISILKNKALHGSINMVFADPPYNLSNNGISVHAGKRVSVNKGDWDKSAGVEEDFNFHKQWIGLCKDVLTPAGTIWISGTYHSIYACGFSLQLHKFHLLNDICWYKPNAAPNISARYFAASHETLLWARRSKKVPHYFDYDLMKHGDWADDRLKNPGKQMRSVWAINTPKTEEKKFGKHPTQKPLNLLKRIILASTQEGDIVLDPFTGSSTTGLATYEYNRNFIGIDKEEDFLELSIKRFNEQRRKGRNTIKKKMKGKQTSIN